MTEKEIYLASIEEKGLQFVASYLGTIAGATEEEAYAELNRMQAADQANPDALGKHSAPAFPMTIEDFCAHAPGHTVILKREAKLFNGGRDTVSLYSSEAHRLLIHSVWPIASVEGSGHAMRLVLDNIPIPLAVSIHIPRGGYCAIPAWDEFVIVEDHHRHTFKFDPSFSEVPKEKV